MITVIMKALIKIKVTNLVEAREDYFSLRMYTDGFKITNDGYVITEGTVVLKDGNYIFPGEIYDNTEIGLAIQDWMFNEFSMCDGQNPDGTMKTIHGDAYHFYNTYGDFGFKDASIICVL